MDVDGYERHGRIWGIINACDGYARCRCILSMWMDQNGYEWMWMGMLDMMEMMEMKDGNGYEWTWVNTYGRLKPLIDDGARDS